ncbi:unnamed protein product [Cylicocyclus nassatus]|uniref:Peptidase A1 domain-containing protein n=1 Tax=Cylicocyclus nassatus TaxID=53992 RepID=A0AA36GK01_CYLNA|nr:unnamed protein product [Cylicocyclus nassatus]
MVTSELLALFTILTCEVIYVNADWYEIPLLPVPNGYAHTIYIGGQEFTVLVTLRNSILWIPSINCTGCGSRHKFDPSKSVSFLNDGTEWRLESWHGQVEGVLGIDNVQSLNVSGGLDTISLHCQFGMVTKMTVHENLQADGMLGLWDFSTQASRPFIYQLKDLSEPWFVINLSQKPEVGAKGSVQYGWRHKFGCNHKPLLRYNYLPEAPYQFQVKITMGSFDPHMLFLAIPDLIPHITGLPELIDGIASCAGAEYINGSYEFDCKDTQSVPDLIITYGQVPLRIASDKLIKKIKDRCVLALAIKSGVAFGAEIYLGAPLFEQYCVSVDFSAKSVGFAKVDTSTPATTNPANSTPTTTTSANATPTTITSANATPTTTTSANSTFPTSWNTRLEPSLLALLMLPLLSLFI